MRFKIDENLHADAAALLAAEGHDVETVHSEGLTGNDDAVIAAHCQAESRVLVCLDLDFADIRVYPPADYAGIIVLRLGNQSRRHVLRVLRGLLGWFNREPLAGRLWIVSEADVRIRGE
jgi:predicted nuclease of predicted toxin-antitoxin system